MARSASVNDRKRYGNMILSGGLESSPADNRGRPDRKHHSGGLSPSNGDEPSTADRYCGSGGVVVCRGSKHKPWLRMQSWSNQSPIPNSLLTGKLIGNFAKSDPPL